MEVSDRKERKSKKRKKVLLLFSLVLAVGVLTTAYLLLRTMTCPLVRITNNHEPPESFSGYTLFTPTVDDLGDFLEKPSKIYLIDAIGEIVHTWSILGSVQLARIRPNGNLLFTTKDTSFIDRAGLREADPFGNVLWYYKSQADHDFYLYENGNILIHCIDKKPVPAIGPGIIWCPRLIEVTRQKEIVWEWRGEEHLDELTELEGIQFPLQKEGRRLYDWAHNNTCQVIGENKAYLKDPRFKPGNIIFSYCNLDTIGIIDRESGQIVWAWGPGILDGMHNPQMLENGHLIIFDNGTERGYSRVIEFDPVSEEIVWEYNDIDSKRPIFFSKYISGAQPLPNENVLICQGEYWRRGVVLGLYRIIYKGFLGRGAISSRLFEVNRDGQIVWDCTITANGKGMLNVYQASRYSTPYLRPLFDKLEKAKSEHIQKIKSLP